MTKVIYCQVEVITLSMDLADLGEVSMEIDWKRFREAIEKDRVKRDVSENLYAKLAKIDQSTLNKFMNNPRRKLRAEIFVRLCTLMGKSPEDFDMNHPPKPQDIKALLTAEKNVGVEDLRKRVELLERIMLEVYTDIKKIKEGVIKEKG